MRLIEYFEPKNATEYAQTPKQNAVLIDGTDDVSLEFDLRLEVIVVRIDGASYAQCTTLQYFGFKPAVATTTLTVDPQSTNLLTANKTQEEMQAEAEQSGWLSFWHEWSWLYP